MLTTTQRLFSLLLIASLSIPASLATGIYKWVDEDGQLHFSDSPVTAQQGDNKPVVEEVVLGPINSFSAPAIVEYVADAESEKKPKARNNVPVTLFSTQTCGYCILAKAYMAKRGIAYTEYDVGTSEYAQRKFIEAGGGSSVPLILVGNYRMVGFDPQRLEAMLDASS